MRGERSSRFPGGHRVNGAAETNTRAADVHVVRLNEERRPLDSVKIILKERHSCEETDADFLELLPDPADRNRQGHECEFQLRRSL
jgi:hypothetical protein